MDLKDTYITVKTQSSEAHGGSSNICHISAQNVGLNNPRNTGLIPCVLWDHNGKSKETQQQQTQETKSKRREGTEHIQPMEIKQHY